MKMFDHWLSAQDAVDYCASHGVKIHLKSIHYHLTKKTTSGHAPKLRGKRKRTPGGAYSWLVSQASLDKYIAYKTGPRVRPRPSVRKSPAKCWGRKEKR